jgi:hypothetical protein
MALFIFTCKKVIAPPPAPSRGGQRKPLQRGTKKSPSRGGQRKAPPEGTKKSPSEGGKGKDEEEVSPKEKETVFKKAKEDCQLKGN